MTKFAQMSRAELFQVVAFAVVLAATTSATAQSDPNSIEARTGQYHKPVSPYPVEMGFSQDHSSTAYEGAMRGRAAVIQAWGNYELDRSQAAVISEQARALNRENDVKQTRALFQQKQLWHDARHEARRQREAQLAAGRQKGIARRATVYAQAYQLSAAQFDSATGAIRWPSVLLDAKYQADREQVDELFRVQLAYGDPQPNSAKGLVRKIDALGRALRSNRTALPREEFLAASKFLAGLKLEAEALG
jgi:hypothetical protein